MSSVRKKAAARLKGSPIDLPFKVGDQVQFTPTAEAMGWYQNPDAWGIKKNEIGIIKEITDGMYVYFDNNRGGWHYSLFTLIKKAE